MKLLTIASLLFCISTAIASHAQTFTSLASLSDKTGAEPTGLGQQANGKLWVTTFTEGISDCGTVFQATLTGTLWQFSSFNCTNGNEPQGLTLGTDGNYYGVTFFGGSGNGGTVFKRTPTGARTVLYNFTTDGSAGSGPVGTLALGPDGNFYGATHSSSSSNEYAGTLFKITPSGTLTTFYTFCLQFGCPDGSQPSSSPVLARDGNFYGTTYSLGKYGGGTAYRITPRGILTTIYSFGEFAGDPSGPTAPLVQAADGNFYSVISQGAANNDGAVFEITPSGSFTVLHNFDGTDGYFPTGLMQATDGNFYGTTAGVDNEINGSIFQMTPAGNLTMLHKFNGTDGLSPIMLIQDTNGTLYGVTSGGGDVYCACDPSFGCGTIFSLDVGLRPFVEAVPAVGHVGAPVTILGTNLKGVKSVKFNGVAAQFTTQYGSEILTAVPPRATTGSIRVTDQNGTLVSNVPFTVTN
jgi:uncharacterized repeat protein (TIGR03803 family)